MISHEHRCIFVHIPKTGGSSIEDVLWPGQRTGKDLWMGFVSRFANKYQTGGLQHLLARQIRLEVGTDVFDQYFKFAFVRNPWDRAISQYASMVRRPDLREYIGMKEDSSFADYLKMIERRSHVQWEKQIEFVQDESGRVVVDFVGRFERLAQDARIVFDRLGLSDAQLPHSNPSSHRPYREYFSGDARDQIRRLYARDIERFGYSYEIDEKESDECS
jgi:hypothetical protein